jgi:hypothetical protein
VTKRQQVVDRRHGTADVVYVHRRNVGTAKAAMQDDGKALSPESPKTIVVSTRT